MKRKLLYVLMFGATSGLIGCAGGGGGGGVAGNSNSVYYSSSKLSSYGFNPGSRTQVPFSTPTLVSTFNPYTGSTGADNVSQQYVVHNLTGDNADDLVITGRMTQPATPGTWVNSNIQIFDWQNGSLVNDTAKWFPGGINSILGTDPTVQFADFFHTGHVGMFISPSTDMNYYGPGGVSKAWLYTNTGSQFNLTTINLPGPVWGHGATMADLTGSGYQDIVIADYGPNTTILLNNKVNGFTAYQDPAGANGALRFGGSSVAAGNFLGTGSTQLVVSDAGCGAFAPGSCSWTDTTKMFSWTIDPATNKLSFGYIKDLPTPIFNQPQYAGLGGNHSYLIMTTDFIGNGIPDLVVFSQPLGSGLKMSAIQFLQNDGQGNFTDVTNKMLIGYNMNTYGTYHPQFIDLGNGLPSMVVSGGDGSGQNNSTQILIKQSLSGPYVSAFQNIITDFAGEANLIAGAQNSQNQVAVVKDAKNNLYLVSTVEYQQNKQTMMGTYISLIGPGLNTVTAQTAFNQVKAQWPWMSPSQVNQVLASTSSSYLTAAGTALALNPDALLTPTGALSVVGSKGTSFLTGGVSGVNLTNTPIQAYDTLGRNFTVNFSTSNLGHNGYTANSEHIDQYTISSHTEYLINGNANTVYTPAGVMRLGYENRNQFNTLVPNAVPREVGINEGDVGLYLGTSPLSQWSVGLPQWYHRGNLSLGTQLTNLNSNPWVNFSGSFGAVQGSMTMENVATYIDNGFSIQGSVTYTTTNFTPGLITNVTPVVAAWGETGYRYTDYDHFGDLGFYLGVKPTVLSGSLEANLPTSVDNTGAPVYTKQNLAINSTPVPYARALYTANINRRQSVRLSGMVAPDGLYRAMVEYRINLN